MTVTSTYVGHLTAPIATHTEHTPPRITAAEHAARLTAADAAHRAAFNAHRTACRAQDDARPTYAAALAAYVAARQTAEALTVATVDAGALVDEAARACSTAHSAARADGFTVHYPHTDDAPAPVVVTPTEGDHL